jgi:integrase
MQHEKVQRASTLIRQMRVILDARELSDNVKKAWLFWARSLLLFNPDQAPEAYQLGDVEAFLKDLEVTRRVSPASRRQAAQAVRCLLSEVLGLKIEGLDELIRAQMRENAPAVLTPQEVQQLLGCLEASEWLMASLVYGAGLRLMECVRLRVRDIEGERIIVRDRNGRFLRETVLPARLREPLRAHLDDRKLEHIRELADGYGASQLPQSALASSPLARSWVWQFVFPGPYLAAAHGGKDCCWRTHHDEPHVRHAIEAAARKAGLKGRVSASTLRNSFALHLIERGVDKLDVERLLGIAETGTDGSVEPAQTWPGGDSPVDHLATH